MNTPKLPLTEAEKSALKKNKIRLNQLINIEPEALSAILSCSTKRAKELTAIVEFQTIPSIGYKFAEKLVFLGYYSIQELRGKNPVSLFDKFEQLSGVWVDPCVEDQFRLVVHYSETPNSKKKWWDFTVERKNHRSKFGYPSNRPKKAWYESTKT